jgi:pantoate--beta-alanine ligase
MIIFKHKKDLKAKIETLKLEGNTVGFVPTMGALHQGHISLVNQASTDCSIVVCSIFVNPTQFNNKKDFEKYPNTIEKDIELLTQTNCAILYLPDVNDIYDNDVTNLQHYDLGAIEQVYDGAFRPGHFQGVCNVVERLFKAVIPHHAYFGLKDYQQCMVIKKLVELMQWENQLQLHFCETLRETDGLAMSSRNMRLSSTQRTIAPKIFETLHFIKNNIQIGATISITEKAKTNLIENGFVPDYIDIADAYTLQPVINWDGTQKIVCVVAAFLGDIRLIDNMIMN